MSILHLKNKKYFVHKRKKYYGGDGGALTVWYGGEKFKSRHLFVFGGWDSLIFLYSQALACVAKLVDL